MLDLNKALLEAVVRQHGMEMARLVEAGADLNARAEPGEVGLRRRPLAGTIFDSDSDSDSDSDGLGPDSAWQVGD